MVIILDFENASVNHVHEEVKNTKGIAYYNTGEIIFGAKGLTLSGEDYFDALGTIAHELCHFAIDMIYLNQCIPFCEGRNDKKSNLYLKPLESYEKVAKENNDSEIVVRSVCNDGLKETSKDYQLAELIARIVVVLALYSKDYEKMKKCSETFRLFLNSSRKTF